MIKKLKDLVRAEVKKEQASIIDYKNINYWIVQNGMYFDNDKLMLRLAIQNKETFKVTNMKVVELNV